MKYFESADHFATISPGHLSAQLITIVDWDEAKSYMKISARVGETAFLYNKYLPLGDMVILHKS